VTQQIVTIARELLRIKQNAAGIPHPRCHVILVNSKAASMLYTQMLGKKYHSIKPCILNCIHNNKVIN